MPQIPLRAAILTISAVVIVGVGVYVLVGDDIIRFVEPYVKESSWGPLFYIVFSALGTFIAPLTSLPLIPLASALWGPLLTALFTIAGWGIGAVIAFLLARHFGRPVVGRFISLEKIDHIGALIPIEREFISVVLLRMVVPVDILSFALGLVSRISLARYTLATFIGIIPFAFLFSYSGGALMGKHWGALALLALGGILLFFLVYSAVNRYGIRR